MKKLLTLITLLASMSVFAELTLPVKCNVTMPDGDQGVLIVKKSQELPGRMFDLSVYKDNGDHQMDMTCVNGEEVVCEEGGIKITLELKAGEANSSLTLNSSKSPMSCF